ncbi:uncharacterized protein [Clytia hemisphaerica]|uniref:uncharacterized protein n=1 Tax=Clytia hemisphaerica TaxID=252671 RepID=UPI0034D59235
MGRSKQGQINRKLNKKKNSKLHKKKVKQQLALAKDENIEIQNKNQKIREENQQIKFKNIEVVTENIKIKDQSEKIKNENNEIKDENVKIKGEIVKINDEKSKVLHENTKITKSLKITKKELQDVKKKLYHHSDYLTSVSKKHATAEKDKSFNTKQNELSEDVVQVSEIKLGEGTFGKVVVGCMTQLGINCAIKSGKKHFDAYCEATFLQRLQGSRFFPYLFGIFNNMLVMEYICFSDGALTIYKARIDHLFNQESWTKICYQMFKALVYIHRKGFLHNDIKSNNILLRSDSTPVIIDFGKSTLRSQPQEYRLTSEQKERYNVRYPYLAHELRNGSGLKTSTRTDIFSLGFVFNFVADKENMLLQGLQKSIQEICPAKRITSPLILKEFQHWESKLM